MNRDWSVPLARACLRAPLLLLVALAGAGALAAQERYRTPPQVVVDVLDAPPLPVVGFSQDREWMLLASRASLPSIAELAEPMLRLAGLRINPRTHGPRLAPRYTGFTLKRIADGLERAVETPAGAKLGIVPWAPDGRRIAYTATWDDRIELWIAATETGRASRVEGLRLNGVLGGSCSWAPDSGSLLCLAVPAGRGSAPAEPPAPAGPTTQRADGRRAPVRTYQDMLGSPHDERLFEYYATAQLVRVDATTGAVRAVGQPGIFTNADLSPDGRYLLVNRAERPFSYAVPLNLFPQRIEVWTADGAPVRTVAELPLGDRIPIRGVRAGPRNVSWRPDRPATLVWVEALDGGDPSNRVEHRDRLVTAGAEAGAPTELARLEQRIGPVRWLERGGQALVTETDRSARLVRTWLLSTEPAGTLGLRMVNTRHSEDAYADPGAPVMKATPGGALVQVSPDGRAIYLTGSGASPEGDRPFLDRLDLATFQAARLWRSEAPYFESVVAVLDADARRIITTRQSLTEPANYVLRDLRARIAPRMLTTFRDPAPQLRAIRRETVRARRNDGVELTGTLYTPPGWQPGQRLPLVLWVYPAEFASADAASQMRGSPHRFTTIGGASHLFLLTQGYAVLDNPSLPVLGGDTANNGYVPQVVAGARAWIQKMVEMGVADSTRVAVGGHSYGAFTTANLLAHSDLFRTGIARSGAYNRTLTPFGFQSEQRTFWQAPGVYGGMSPFNYADRVNEPILLIHGEADNNSGTFPVQSERFFAALQGHGAVAELVMYPHEAHGYAARETIMDCVARMIEWFDRYLKPAVSAQRAAGP